MAATEKPRYRTTDTYHNHPGRLNEHETGETINDWVLATFGATGTNESVVARANTEMSELITASADREVAKMLEEAADVVITLNRLFHRNGTTMQAEVDKKMAINRKRKWTVRNGHGQHVEGT